MAKTAEVIKEVLISQSLLVQFTSPHFSALFIKGSRELYVLRFEEECQVFITHKVLEGNKETITRVRFQYPRDDIWSWEVVEVTIETTFIGMNGYRLAGPAEEYGPHSRSLARFMEKFTEKLREDHWGDARIGASILDPIYLHA